MVDGFCIRVFCYSPLTAQRERGQLRAGLTKSCLKRQQGDTSQAKNDSKQ